MAPRALLCLLAVGAVTAFPQGAQTGRKYELDGRIVGGSETTIQKYPFAVTLWRSDLEYYPEWNMCGASIISSQWVLTAGHCTTGRDAKALFIRAGSTNKNNGTKYEVEKFVVHPKFFEHQDGSADFDISVIKLKTPVQFSRSVKAASLPSASTVVSTGTMLTVIGWGSTHELGGTVDVLREVSVPVVSTEECTADYGKDINNATMICAGYRRGGKDSCQGDSGGPLVLGSTQVGVVSWGGGCAEARQPGVYTRVANFRDWIKSETGL
ncbi:trypsin 3A1-like [Bacillus rossius redtenbacheri]|uniref:trypsin 3A1-like n=1 Tax=Bacillus rossius redtenbacheri TaxID=93214 RepID=UPI002FDE965D